MTSGQFSSSIAVSKKVVENLKQMKATIVFLALGVAVKRLKLFPGVAVLAMALAGSGQDFFLLTPFIGSHAELSYQFNQYNPDFPQGFAITNSYSTSRGVLTTSVVSNGVNRASALQSDNGFNALSINLADTAGTFRHRNVASVIWGATVQNLWRLTLPLDLRFRISPGRIQLTDGTSEGLDANPRVSGALSGSITFRIYTQLDNNKPETITQRWIWTETFGGGRNGQTNNSGGLDPEGLGHPLSVVDTNGSRITKSFDGFDSVVSLGALEPNQQMTLNYFIEVAGVCDCTSITGPTGVLVEIGDPFEIESGEMGGIGSSFVLMSGNTVVLPVPLSLLIRPTNNLVELSWPSVASGAVLESNAKLGDTNWNIVASPTATNGSKISALVGKEDAQRFFRLRQ